MRLRPLVSYTSVSSSRPKRLPRSAPWVCASCKVSAPNRRFFSSSRRSAEKPFYVTTPIFYVNADPHLGHLHTTILVDVLKRWQQLLGKKAIMLTGTDEHGIKIQQAAAKAGSDPKAFVDKGAEVFKHLSVQANVKYDRFIRTTEKEHKEAVEYAWFLLSERGYIYESKHEGWYSVSDETFFPQSAVHLILDPPTGRKLMASIETGNEVEWTSETNYRFRLSAFKEHLLEFYEKNPNWIQPHSRMEEVVEAVSSGLEDLSVSRPFQRLRWGIRVPRDQTQTIYVWLDALLNYTTAAGYPWAPGNESAGGWPADFHVIGKDIVRFHTIYWPAILMALGLPLPRGVITHGHWTLGDQKMSKSRGNVVNPFSAMERFGVDTIRYYLMRWGSFANDSKYENSLVVATYKKDLQGGLGNLAARVVRSSRWSVREAITSASDELRSGTFVIPENEAQHQLVAGVADRCAELMQRGNAHATLQIIIDVIYKTNAWIAVAAPWNISRELRELERDQDAPEAEKVANVRARLNETVYVAAETLRILGILLQPFIPDKAAMLFELLGVDGERRSFKWARYGVDEDYGVCRIRRRRMRGNNDDGQLFPPLLCED